MNVAIVGPGALGLLVAARFSRNDTGTTLVDYRPERAHRIQKTGISCESFDGIYEVPILLMCGLQDCSNIDLVIICVKGRDTEKVAHELSDSGYDGFVLTLQNGFRHVDILRQHFDEKRILIGTATVGSTLLECGKIRDHGNGEILIGPAGNRSIPVSLADKLRELFISAQFRCEIVRNAEPILWSKLLVNLAINPLTAIFQVNNGDLLDVPAARTLMRHLVTEAVQVAEAKNVSLPYRDPLEYVEQVCRITSNNLSSMLQDLLHNRPTEIDFLNGALLEEASALGVPCPINEVVTHAVKKLEQMEPAEFKRTGSLKRSAKRLAEETESSYRVAHPSTPMVGPPEIAALKTTIKERER